MNSNKNYGWVPLTFEPVPVPGIWPLDGQMCDQEVPGSDRVSNLLLGHPPVPIKLEGNWLVNINSA